MAILSWLFVPQAKKIQDGYFLNHNNLAALNPVDRQRVITYFILCQTPEKFNPNDRRVLEAHMYSKFYLANRLIPTATYSDLLSLLSTPSGT